MSLAIAFHSDGPRGGQEYILKRVEESGVTIIRNNDVPHIVLVSASEQALEREAGRIDLLKITKNGKYRNFQLEDASEFEGYGSDTFFLPSERNLLLSNILDHVRSHIRSL